MRLTQFSDYALRTALYLGAKPGQIISVGEIATAYRISYNHLAKVASALCDLGVAESVRGRRGGIRLAMEPTAINVGWLVRQTEPDFTLVECFDEATDTCPITPACRLRNALTDALQRFLAALDEHTLADFLDSEERRDALIQLWRAPRAADG
ncbi:MAG: Rrf2 family transcriptional regulator [Gemmatimonadaceae bacterium]|nr:Rrf2 family transcriptional regulator [Gemmatimonadaceae bacterium]